MHRPISRLAGLLLILTLGLAACSSPAAPAAESAPAEATAATAADPTATVAPPAEPKPTTPPADSTGAVTTTTAITSTGPVTAENTSATAATRVFAIDPARSEAAYQVDEEFLGQELSFVKTVGKTQSITGTIELGIDGSTVTLGDNEFTVNLSTLTSDQPRRDRAIQRDWLQSATYPLAVFKATSVTDLPADAAQGKEVAFKLGGDITIREITKPITWDVKATLDGGTLSGVAQTLLLMRDFGFEPPDIAGMLKVTDGVTVTLNFAADELQ